MTHLDMASKYAYYYLSLKEIFIQEYVICYLYSFLIFFAYFNSALDRKLLSKAEFFLLRVSIDSLSSDAREWSERIGTIRKNVKKADDDLKNLMNTFLKVEHSIRSITYN